MSKTLLIAKSEYLRRVTSKTFLLVTLLAPLLLVGVSVVPTLLVATLGDDSDRTIALVDETGGLAAAIRAELPERFVLEEATAPLDSLRADILADRLDGVLVLPAALLDSTQARPEATFYSSGGGIGQFDDLSDAVRDAVRNARLDALGAGTDVRAAAEARPRLRPVTVSEDGDASGGTFIATAVGFAIGMAVYFAVFIYGMLVMRGVIEEKQNRIVEVIASSVRPFELMMGKVLGIGAVGLTQIVVWGGIVVGVMAALGPIVAAFAGPPDPAVADAAGQAAAELPFDMAALKSVLSPGLFLAVLVFFLGGYLLYAALFAAVGSAVEQESDAQTLQLPATLPIVVSIMFLFYLIENPDATLSAVLSMVPFCSPILMPVRMAVTDVPWWQVGLSLALLVAGFLAVLWMAARIYRVGILMYGKRPTFRELARWARTA